MRLALGGPRVLWLVGGLIALWLFAFRLHNAWDIMESATTSNAVVFVVIPLYVTILNIDILHPWQSLTAIRMASVARWWSVQIATAGAMALLLGVGLALLSVSVAMGSHRWTWQWGTYGRNSEPPARLASPPWVVPWHWSLEALLYLVLGLWAIGVLRHVLALWWRAPWLAWLAMVALAFMSQALTHTAGQALVWWLPGAQFSYWYHWGTTQPYALAWTLVYSIIVIGVAAGVGLLIAQRSRWDAAHGRAP